MSHREFDIVMPGYLFCDLIFLGLPGLPRFGEEVFGEALHVTVGGVFNSAVAMRRLGLRIGLIADLGDDLFSDFIRAHLRAENIPGLLIRNHEKPMPTITAVLSFPHDRAFVTYMADLDDTGPFPSNTLDAYPARHLHLPGLKEAFASRELIDGATRRGLTISLDCQWHPDLMDSPEVWSLLESIDVFLPNEKESMYLTRTDSPEAALESLGRKVQSVVIKLGEKGAIGQDLNTAVTRVPALDVKAVDTTGAGDSFNAGFLFAYLRGLPLRESMAYGNVCAGLSVTAPGGGTAAPTIEQLEEKLGEGLGS